MSSYIILIAGIVLFSVIFSLAYRIFTLVGISKRLKVGANIEESEEIGNSSANRYNAVLFPISYFLALFLVVYYNPYLTRYFLPEAASQHGPHLDFLFWLSMGVIIFAFLVTATMLFLFPYFYRFKKSRIAKFYPHNDRLEIIWTIIPAVVMALLVITGWMAWSDITSPASEEALEIEIMGKQFNWQVRYPGNDEKLGGYDFRQIDEDNSFGIDFMNDMSNAKDDFVPGKLYLPKGREVVLKIRARDVLHSVFLPHFRVKMDAVPGTQTHFKFTPTITTKEMREKLSQEESWQELNADGEPRWKNFNYELACTEICGGGHFAMKLAVEVLEQEEFEKWYSEQQPWLDKDEDRKARYVQVASPVKKSNIAELQ